MATKEEIKAAILEVAGSPSSGPIADLADAWADAIVRLDTKNPAKEVRIVESKETR
jgi:hypothetical protein